MANDFYTASGTPSTGSPGSSAPVRSEFVLIQAGFNKLAALTASTIVGVNAGGTAQTNLTTTGTGDVVLATSPTLITPNLGTPSAGVLTNCTGLPVSAVSGLGAGVGTALAIAIGSAGAAVTNGGVLGTPSSGTLTSCTGLPISSGVSGLGAGVATALAGSVTGSGTLVLASAPTLTNPIVGTQSAADNSTKAASTAYVDALFASGTFTPTDASGGLLTLTSPVGFYRKVGNMVTVWGSLTFPLNSDANQVTIGSLPFTAANLTTHTGGFVGVGNWGGGAGTPGSGAPYVFYVVKNATQFRASKGGGSPLLNSDATGSNLDFSFTYPI